MGRARTLVPEMFFDEHLQAADEDAAKLSPKCRGTTKLLWLALHCQADREGRFVWSELSIKASCLPFDGCDVGVALAALVKAGCLLKYRVGKKTYGAIVGFSTTQAINNRERSSELPGPLDADEEEPDNVSTFASLPPPEAITASGQRLANASEAPFVGGVEFPLRNGSVWALPVERARRLAVAHNSIDVEVELRKASEWCEANASRRKTARGMPAFLNRWLTTAARGQRSASRGTFSIPELD